MLFFLNNWIHYQAPCLKFTSVGRVCARGLCMPHGEGGGCGNQRESVLSVSSKDWTQLSRLGREYLHPLGHLAVPCPLPMFFQSLAYFFSLFILRSYTCFLIISTLRNEGTKLHTLGLCGLGLTLLTRAMDHLCSSLGKIALRVILIWVFILSSRCFFWSTWTFTYVSFSLDDC